MKPLALRQGKHRSTIAVDNQELLEMLSAYKQMLVSKLEEVDALDRGSKFGGEVVRLDYETAISNGGRYYTSEQLQAKLNAVQGVLDLT